MREDRDLLIRGMLEIGIQPSDEIVGRFLFHLGELLKWNMTYNLTALRDRQKIVIRHFLDSLLFLDSIPECAVTAADIGSGAGFPGLPIACVRPDINMTLVESSRKKSSFLSHIRRTLSLDRVEVVHDRAEALAGRTFDVVLVRAVVSLRKIIEGWGHLLSGTGCVIAGKGPKGYAESLDVPPGYFCEIRERILPFDGAHRFLIRITRASGTG